MTGERVVRRLAAILAADIAGYSRLMGRDEQGTLTRLKVHRAERLEPTLARHGGRLVKLTGDGVLAEFPSAVDALSAAIEFQQAMAEAGRGQPDETAIVFRIGLHLGDLIVEGDDLYGDGVNVAARLEAEAPAGGIVISGDVHNAVVGRLQATFRDLGDLALKNIVRPVRAFRVEWEASEWSATTLAGSSPAVAPSPDAPLALPDKPSIAVLPFQNMSGDPEQEYFADGIAEDIITALSRFRSLFVIARHSSFTYKGHAVDVRQVGRDLGVRYVLEGSVRRAAGRVRFTAQLVDTAGGGHVWADKYEGPVEDLFDLQDRITEAVVGVLEPAIRQAEIERVRRKRPENLGAYDHYLRSLALTDTFTRESIQAILDGCHRAIALDPSFAPAYAVAAHSYVEKLLQGWIVDRAKDSGDALRLVERGLRADRLDPIMLAHAGLSFMWFEGDLAKAAAYIDEAIAINPNYAYAFLFSGVVRIRMGETQAAMDHLKRVVRLSPRDLWSYGIFQTLALAYIVDGDAATARDWAQRAVRLNPNYLPGWTALASSAAATGRDTEARMAADRVLALNPTFSIRKWAQYTDARGIFAPYIEGMRRAGLPE